MKVLDRMPDQPDADGIDADWQVCLIRREGAPPIRFTGRAVCVELEGDTAIRFWAVRSGGTFLEHTIWQNGSFGTAAKRHRSLEAAMSALEVYCRNIRADTTAMVLEPSCPGTTLPEAILLLARRDEWVRRFLVLAGAALTRMDAAVALDRHGGMR